MTGGDAGSERDRETSLRHKDRREETQDDIVTDLSLDWLVVLQTDTAERNRPGVGAGHGKRN